MMLKSEGELFCARSQHRIVGQGQHDGCVLEVRAQKKKMNEQLGKPELLITGGIVSHRPVFYFQNENINCLSSITSTHTTPRQLYFKALDTKIGRSENWGNKTPLGRRQRSGQPCHVFSDEPGKLWSDQLFHRRGKRACWSFLGLEKLRAE